MYTPCKIKDLQGQDKNKNLSKASSLEELIENCPENKVIGDNLVKAWTFINDDRYEKIVCSISGGSDSDVMLDIVWRCDKDNKVDYVWFNTGLEYQATKDHLKFLEEKYDIKIRDYRAIKPIPTSCKEYGQPFISKNVAEMIDRLQRHNFQWEDEPLDVLYKTANGCKHMKYPDKNKIHTWFCDDGNRESVKELAEQMGIGYQGLANNKLAKAGNLNNALSKTSGALVATFDAE